MLPCLVATWALGGLYASLGPSLVATVFGIDDHLVGSLLILALNGTGLIGSLSLRGVAPARAVVDSTRSVIERVVSKRTSSMGRG